MLCPQCGTENRLGAIFCRSCGVKLDIDSIDSETFEEKTGIKLKKGPKISTIILKVVLLLVLIGLAAAIFLATRVPDIERTPTATKGKNSIASFDVKKRQAEWFKANDYEYKLGFTEGDINSYLAEKFKESDLKKGFIEFKEIDIDLKPGNMVEARFFGTMWGKKLLFRVTGRVELTGGTLKFEPESARIGQLPLPGILINPTYKNMMSAGAEDEKLFKKFEAIQIHEDKVVAHIDGKRKYQPKQKRPRR